MQFGFFPQNLETKTKQKPTVHYNYLLTYDSYGIIDFIGANALLGPGGGRGPWTFLGLKESRTQDFGLQVIFMNKCPQSPQVFHWGRFEFFRKFAEIFANEYLSVINCSAVSRGNNQKA